METKLNKTELQRICVVILKNDFQVEFNDIADALSITKQEAKELYLQLIRVLENSSLEDRTQTN